jgi:hypothetical protein
MDFNFMQQQQQQDLDSIFHSQPSQFQAQPNPVMDIYLSLPQQKQKIFMELVQQNQVCISNEQQVISGDEFTQKVKILLDPNFVVVRVLDLGFPSRRKSKEKFGAVSRCTQAAKTRS